MNTPAIIHPSGPGGPGPGHNAGASNLAASLSGAGALMACVLARVPDRLLDAIGVRGWALELIVVVVAVTGVRALARAAFTSTTSTASTASTALAAAIGGVAFTLPIYALLRLTPRWWLFAWALFALITVASQAAMPLVLRVQSGPLTRADAGLEARVRAVAASAGVDVAGGVHLAGGQHANAYVAGLGRKRRVVLEEALARWPAPLVDQVVAHEFGHWRLGHTARRLPLALAAQFVTFAVAGGVLSWSWPLDLAGVATAGDPRSYPLLLLLTPLLVVPARLAVAAYDRAQERAADRFALTLLRDPADFAAMLERAAGEGGAPRRLSWWRRAVASHPPIDERALACTRFALTT